MTLLGDPEPLFPIHFQAKMQSFEFQSIWCHFLCHLGNYSGWLLCSWGFQSLKVLSEGLSSNSWCQVAVHRSWYRTAAGKSHICSTMSSLRHSDYQHTPCETNEALLSNLRTWQPAKSWSNTLTAWLFVWSLVAKPRLLFTFLQDWKTQMALDIAHTCKSGKNSTFSNQL